MKNLSSEELKQSSLDDLNGTCEEIRKEIFETVSVCGGHLSSNLGVVELTVALCRVFDFPRDKIVFDVGHQCYAYKLLTGRADRFSTLRQEGGLSGFPKRSESEYDVYDTGHAGTAVSAALGIAKARDLKGEDFSVVALVGDGSFNNGLIYEALNSVRILQTSVLIILNDNGMSISPTVGGTKDILSEIKTGAGGAERDISLFERYGLQYMGVIDGNDLKETVSALSSAKEKLKTGSVLLHVNTQKGHGYPFSENAPDRTHGVSPDRKVKGAEEEYGKALGEELTALAEKDGRIVAVTAAMTDSLGLRPFFNAFPQRAFDVGICEEHASVLCASMAAAGMRPYYAIYSTFLQRAFDEIVHDVCGQNLPVTFCIDRAGISGADGETHQGVFDLSYLSPIPNLTIAIPKDVAEFRAMLRASADYGRPLAIRYPRCGKVCDRKEEIEFGKFEVLHSTMSNIVFMAAGERALTLAERVRERCLRNGKDFSVVNARFLKPLDETLLRSRKEKYVVTLEDNVAIGGLGEAIARYYRNSGKEIYCFAYRDEFIPHGEVASLAAKSGLNEEEIYRLVGELYARG
ncbi:MAG: 1-deoxy-D-xylulose-5-phosphate synthase [Candidatus Gallimonas sp.]